MNIKGLVIGFVVGFSSIAFAQIATSPGTGVTTITNNPGGSDTQVQFNDGGAAFGGDSAISINKSTHVLTVGDLLISNGKAIKSDTTAAHTILIQGYDTDTGPGYVTFWTITNGTAPSAVLGIPAGGATVTIQATTYKSSDGSSGATGSLCSSFKNGLCVAAT